MKPWIKTLCKTGILAALGLSTLMASSVQTLYCGGDKDVHGCIGSAGYKWCAKTGKCERSWELAKKNKLEKTIEAFDAFCGNRN